MKEIKLYDTTLRDGMQGEGIVFSLEDKIKIVKKIDEIGIHYIEGGWPGSNPKDVEFFKEIRSVKLKNAKIVAFGSTRKVKNLSKDDENLKALVKSGTSIVTIFGKTWDLHVHETLRTTLNENLNLIKDSIKFIKDNNIKVFYDAEHFFDGFRANKEYAIKTLKAAEESGVDYIILCDTNGGTLPFEIRDIIEEVKKYVNLPLGMHAHNDSDVAVANTLIAVQCGVSMVQGTINGYGERCGNANLCSVIPDLQVKMGYMCLPSNKLKELTSLSVYISEVANLKPQNNIPFVGYSAFAHKGGIHVDAVKKNPKSYEHINPGEVGNKRRILISELSGISNITHKAMEFNIELKKESTETSEVLKKIKELENQGYSFENAEASFELLMKKTMKTYKPFFDLEGFRVIVENRNGKLVSEATIKIKVKGVFEHTASEGNGPIDALNNALRKALEEFYPSVKSVHLRDFKVRILDPDAATRAMTRVIIESTDGKDVWNTIGVSENIIEASWYALVDSLEYKLIKDGK
ncbi:MAG: citramalate synthase [Candidatus Firestonebacteria bacterium]